MIAVIDYGLGNLRSIAKALEYVGADVCVTNDKNKIKSADKLILPGVGAFGDGINNLKKLGIIPVLEEEVLAKKKPIWGICLGMQLMAKKSEEFGFHDGLGWISAGVVSLAGGFNRRNLKIPHVGWNTVAFVREHPVISGLNKSEDFYFVHSFHAVPENPGLALGTCDYGGEFCACIANGNIFATQFHPEKSQGKGLKMLKNFVSM